MAEGFNVEISSKSQIKYPEECIVCGRNAKGQEGKIHVGPSEYMFFSSKNKIKVPMHNKCSTQYKIAFWKRYWFIIAIGALLAIAYIIYIERTFNLDSFLSRIVLLIIVFIVVLPIAIWQSKRPLSIECEHEKDNYIFTFKNRNYAERFAQINGSDVIKRT